VAFSPDGKHIISGSNDKTLRLWDASTGTPIGQPMKGHEDAVISVAFSPDSKHIISGSNDRTLRLWDVSWGSWLQIGCNQLRHHSILVNPITDEAKDAKKTCQQYVWR
jgi:WD40 repeat protein